MLASSEATLAEFAYKFTFFVEFHLAADGVKIHVEVHNGAEEPMPFTAALHTYFTVGDITQVGVAGVAGCTYLNNLGGREEVEGTEDPIRFEGEAPRLSRALVLHSLCKFDSPPGPMHCP